MRFLIQRVSSASVSVENKIVGAINEGLLVLVGIHTSDTEKDVDWLLKKTANMRIFSDAANAMNHSVIDIEGSVLFISQFTLYASTKKGNRPSFTDAAPPEEAIQLYNYLLNQAKILLKNKVASGIFGADMKVSLINNGPVTIWLDSQNKL